LLWFMAIWYVSVLPFCKLCAYIKLTGTANTRAIPFYNVLWAELKDSELTLRYASPASKTVVRAATLKYPIEYQMVEQVNKWTKKLLDRSYGESQQKKRMKVLVNPHSGKGSAESILRKSSISRHLTLLPPALAMDFPMKSSMGLGRDQMQRRLCPNLPWSTSRAGVETL